MSSRKCFMNGERPCDLTCKAAFEIDDPIDNVDCYFIWLAYHFGEGFYELKRMLEQFGGGSGPGAAPWMQGPKSPKGPAGNN